MIRILRFCVVLILVWAVCTSGGKLHSAIAAARSEGLAKEAIRTLPRRANGEIGSWNPQANAALDSALNVASHYDRGGEAQIESVQNASGMLKQRIELSADPAEQLKLRCEALRMFGRNLERQPFNSSLLLAWASIRQLLGSLQCEAVASSASERAEADRYTTGNFADAVSLARKWEPSNPAVLFGGAMVSLWAGERSEALALFKNLVTYSLSIDAGQEALILDELQNAAEFTTVVPSRLPQVATWSRLLKARRPISFTDWAPQIAQMQMQAIEEARIRYETDELPLRAYLSALRSLEGVVPTEEARRVLDREMAGAARRAGAPEFADYLEARAAMDDILIVPAAQHGDSRPEATSLTNWAILEPVWIDDFHQSTGFYVARNQSVKLISLHAREGLVGKPVQTNQSDAQFSASLSAARARQQVSTVQAPELVKVYASDDNNRWQELPIVSSKLINFENQRIFLLEVPQEEHRYWKVHTQSAQRSRAFGNELPNLIRVYGASAARQREARK